MLLPAAVLSLSLLLLQGTSLAQTGPARLPIDTLKTRQQLVQPLAPPGGQSAQKSAALRKTDPYLDSAHGSSEKGVARQEKAREGFARANCSHCHEFHGETDVSGSSSGRKNVFPYTLYAQNFETKARTGVYTETTNFCFTCHNANGSAQRVSNNYISQSLGCSTLQGPTDILGAFNEKSRHNLYDIWKHLDTESRSFSWVSKETNPCSACHNPHLARNHRDNPRDILFSSLSKPSDHSSLWVGSMDESYSTQYEPPFCSNENNREPAATTRADLAREATIDYVALCTDCHNDNKNIFSSTLERNLVEIDWSNNGDVHGERIASATLTVKPPYILNSQKNYVLSCLDCHEPHGSGNTALLRNWVNGGKLLGTISASIAPKPGTGNDTQNMEMGYLCLRCHEPDVDTGTDENTPPTWQTVHHGATDSTELPEVAPPYAMTGCESCHELEGGATGTPLPIECVNCHFHGGTDEWLKDKDLATDRQTF